VLEVYPKSIKSILWQNVRHLPAVIKEKATEIAKSFGMKKSLLRIYDELLKKIQILMAVTHQYSNSKSTAEAIFKKGTSSGQQWPAPSQWQQQWKKCAGRCSRGPERKRGLLYYDDGKTGSLISPWNFPLFGSREMYEKGGN